MIRTLTFLAVLLLPIYLWQSGGLQLSHALLLFAAGLYVLKNGIGFMRSEVILSCLAIFVLFREGYAVSHGEKPVALISFLYVVFTLMAFNFARRWLRSERNIHTFRWAVSIAVAVAIAGIIVKGYGFTVDAEGERAIGTFNNPNQLGYFSVCAFCIAALTYLRGGMKLWLLCLLFCGTLLLAIASLSKAAMISIAFSGLMASYTVSRSRLSFFIGTGIALTLIVIAVYLVNAGYLNDFKFIERLRGLGEQSDDSLQGRGYNILLDFNAWQFFFGFGAEGVKHILGHELHSTVFSFFASYGAVGGLLFLAFHIDWVKRMLRTDSALAVVVVAVPPLMYGLTHNGSRFTIYWLLLALCFSRRGKEGVPASVFEKQRVQFQ
jgi:O-antigen ligase